MEDRRGVSFAGVWRGIYPILLYELIQIASALAYAAWLLGAALLRGGSWEGAVRSFGQDYAEGTVLIVLIGALASLPVFGWLYCRDVQKRPYIMRQQEDRAPTEAQLLWTVIASAALALFANNLLSLLPLGDWSKRYEQTNEALYMGSIWLRMACIGFFAPAAEELLMRGLFYKRFREMVGAGAAMTISALAFGLIHGNIVQGIYAFWVGLFFAWLMERFGRIIVPTLAHMSANLIVVLVEDSDGLSELIYGSTQRFLVGTLACGGLFLALFLLLKNREA